MQGDELKSEQKSAIVFKEGNDVKDARLKLADEDMKWWKDAKFGMFIHWGLYAIPATGEWSMTRRNIPTKNMINSPMSSYPVTSTAKRGRKRPRTPA